MIRPLVRLPLSTDCPRLAGLEAKCAQAVRSKGRSRDYVPTSPAVRTAGLETDLGSSWVHRSSSCPHEQSRTASRCATGFVTLEGSGCAPWVAPSGGSELRRIAFTRPRSGELMRRRQASHRSRAPRRGCRAASRSSANPSGSFSGAKRCVSITSSEEATYSVSPGKRATLRYRPTGRFGVGGARS
jgi:hypothetical protein